MHSAHLRGCSYPAADIESSRLGPDPLVCIFFDFRKHSFRIAGQSGPNDAAERFCKRDGWLNWLLAKGPLAVPVMVICLRILHGVGRGAAGVPTPLGPSRYCDDSDRIFQVGVGGVARSAKFRREFQGPGRRAKEFTAQYPGYEVS